MAAIATLDPHHAGHSHVFLGTGHARAERRTWWVIGLCGVMMALEIGGGLLFGSIALVADGLHMSTHAGALLLAALAYRYARRLAQDERFSFGTGKLGDLAGFASAIVLAMIALLIGYEAVSRLFAPGVIDFAEAIPIAVLGLLVNIASVWLLGGMHRHHGPGAHHHGDPEEHRIAAPGGAWRLSVFEDGVPPVFRLCPEAAGADLAGVTIATTRPDGARQVFSLQDRGGWLESIETIPEPHAFTAHVHLGAAVFTVPFTEHDHAGDAAHRDHNLRAAVVHVLADAAVSALVIAGLLLARAFGWNWLDPLAGLVGASVIATWSYGLIRDTGAILLDMVPDRRVAEGVRAAVAAQGDQVADLHLWRLGPGHLGAILSVVTRDPARGAEHYRQVLGRFPGLSHVTIEVVPG
jgi:cation diffusion facilitator family transporter